MNLLLLSLIAIAEGASIYNHGFSENSRKIGTQEHLFPYLAGNAPYFKYPLDYGINLPIPEQCELKQVQLLARHGERYPSKSKGVKLSNVYKKLQNYTGALNGSLSFLNDDEYEIFWKDSSQLELEVTFNNTLDPLNPYTGEQSTRTHARRFISLYGDLLAENSTLELFTTNSKRVHDTAAFFAEELDNYVKDTHMNIISEDSSSGANNLSPGYSCLPWDEYENEKYLSEYSSDYLENIADRLNNENKNLPLNLTATDANSLFVWCGFELSVKGYSEACDIFTDAELIHFSYEDDLYDYYQDGPGHSLAKPIGSLLFNASVELLKQSEDLNQKAWLSFTHDTDIINYLATVGLFDNGEKLNATSVSFRDHIYRKSWMTPMAARLYTEKFQCSNETFIRYTLNDAVIPIESCSSGPGFSCPEKEFYSYAEKKLDGMDFVEACDIKSSSNYTTLSFYWDYEKINYNSSLLIQ